jgi:MOSC domain
MSCRLAGLDGTVGEKAWPWDLSIMRSLAARTQSLRPAKWWAASLSCGVTRSNRCGAARCRSSSSPTAEVSVTAHGRSATPPMAGSRARNGSHNCSSSAPSMRYYFQLRTGTFFEIGAVYLLGSGSVGHLRELQGGTALIDRRRFRPNIYIDTGPAMDRFVEDEWIGGTLEVVGTVVLDEFQPTLWCVTSTLAQEELPRDRSVLRTTAQHHAGCLGVYASVRRPGLVRVGDQVVLHGPGVAQVPSRVSGRAGSRRRN